MADAVRIQTIRAAIANSERAWNNLLKKVNASPNTWTQDQQTQLKEMADMLQQHHKILYQLTQLHSS